MSRGAWLGVWALAGREAVAPEDARRATRWIVCVAFHLVGFFFPSLAMIKIGAELSLVWTLRFDLLAPCRREAVGGVWFSQIRDILPE